MNLQAGCFKELKSFKMNVKNSVPVADHFTRQVRPEKKDVTTHYPGSQSASEAPSRKIFSADNFSINDELSLSPVWKKLAGSIKVSQATPHEILRLSQTLFDAKIINTEDHILLSFQPELNPDDLSETKPFSHKRKDYIALWENKQEAAMRFGAGREELEGIYRIQSILKYVESLN